MYCKERRKVRLEYPMVCMAKVDDVRRLEGFLDEYVGILARVPDGIEVVATYDNGELMSLTTRGDGRIGEDIFYKHTCVGNLPEYIKDGRHIVISGVIVVEDMEIPLEDMWNPRTIVGNFIRDLCDVQVNFVPTDLVNAIELGITRVSDGLTFISEFMNVVEWTMITRRQVRQFVEEYKKANPYIRYATHGVTLTYNDLLVRSMMGAIVKFPLYAKSFSWE